MEGVPEGTGFRVGPCAPAGAQSSCKGRAKFSASASVLHGQFGSGISIYRRATQRYYFSPLTSNLTLLKLLPLTVQPPLAEGQFWT